MDHPDPFDKFRGWYDEALLAGQELPNAMALSTVRADGSPASRMVLLSSFDRRGFVFHTHYDSAKGIELSASSRAALLFWWGLLNRQVRIEGTAERTGHGESESYFAGRPRGAQIGAWASDQSRILAGREALAARFREVAARYEGMTVPRPPRWGGIRVSPRTFEFWTGREDRLHERIRYELAPSGWTAVELFP